MQSHILFVEDDIELAQLIAKYLSAFGYEVVLLHSGEYVVETVLNTKPDLVLLDIMLPGKDGLSICRELRALQCTMPIIMLTSINSDTNQILGFEVGATDYVVKTTPPSILLARIKSHLRHTMNIVSPSMNSQQKDLLDFGTLRIDHTNRSVYYLNKLVNFSTGELDLLWELAIHAGEISSRDSLLKALRGVSYDGLDRSIDTAISRLRKKLGDDPTNPRKIKTIRHKGYLFVHDVWRESGLD